jgi:hypothetical protein
MVMPLERVVEDLTSPPAAQVSFHLCLTEFSLKQWTTLAFD